MLDIHLIRTDTTVLDAAMASRGQPSPAVEIIRLDTERRALMTQLQDFQSRRNNLAKEIGQKKAKQENVDDLMAQASHINTEIPALEARAAELEEQQHAILSRVPNIPLPDVPLGKDETENVEINRWGPPTPIANPQAHFELGEKLGLMDFATAATLSGSRFAFVLGDLARLERALATFMLDTLRTEGFTEVQAPLLVNSQAMFGTGQLPKFEDDQFQTTDGRWLIPTAEVSLTNYVAGKILSDRELPLLFCSYTPCFRKEAGSAGKDTRGYIRMHQFYKVEMVAITRPEESPAMHKKMTRAAESMLEKLGLPYRTVVLCTGDMGFCAAKTHDLEVWLPAQNTYREISSVSTCTDFQARRMKARYKTNDGKTAFVHTLNGSGLAVGRTLVAVMENYQQPDGSIAIPAVIQPYMGGQQKIEKA